MVWSTMLGQVEEIGEGVKTALEVGGVFAVFVIALLIIVLVVLYGLWKFFAPVRDAMVKHVETLDSNTSQNTLSLVRLGESLETLTRDLGTMGKSLEKQLETSTELLHAVERMHERMGHARRT